MLLCNILPGGSHAPRRPFRNPACPRSPAEWLKSGYSWGGTSMAEAAAETGAVSLSRERDGVGLIHLTRPRANSYDKAFLDDLNAAIDEIRFDDGIRGEVVVSDLP